MPSYLGLARTIVDLEISMVQVPYRYITLVVDRNRFPDDIFFNIAPLEPTPIYNLVKLVLPDRLMGLTVDLDLILVFKSTIY